MVIQSTGREQRLSFKLWVKCLGPVVSQKFKCYLVFKRPLSPILFFDDSKSVSDLEQTKRTPIILLSLSEYYDLIEKQKQT